MLLKKISFYFNLKQLRFSKRKPNIEPASNEKKHRIWTSCAISESDSKGKYKMEKFSDSAGNRKPKEPGEGHRDCKLGSQAKAFGGCFRGEFWRDWEGGAD